MRRALCMHTLARSPLPHGQVQAIVAPPAQIQISGQASGDSQHNLMGVYELQDVSTHWVNGRGVWKLRGKEGYLYYASTGNWFVGDKENMLAGKNSGWMYTAADTALTPDKISAEWTVYTGTEWEAAPKVTGKRSG